MQLELSPPLFVLFRSIVEERSGLQYQIADRDALRDRLVARASELGLDSLLDYYYYLRYDPGGAAELDRLVERLVVGETYFFRELEPLHVAVEEVLRPLAARGEHPRVWCAACSTGEEPITLAILLASAGFRERVEIVATDISRSAIDRARAGSFGRRAVRRDVPLLARGWLDVVDDVPRVRPEIIEGIHWERLNLLDAHAVAALGTFDLVLCRNVLIYFSEETVRRVLASLHGALRPNGVLLVGISESLLRFGSTLALEERGGVSFYRKRGEPR